MYQKKVSLKGAKYIFGKCKYCNCPITDLDLKFIDYVHHGLPIHDKQKKQFVVEAKEKIRCVDESDCFFFTSETATGVLTKFLKVRSF